MRHAVIMAGGSGTRLWPLSRSERPKQLLDVVAGQDGGMHSLLAEAFGRLRAVLPADRIWVCTAVRYADAVRAALPSLHPDRLVLEPTARDTANAVGLAATLVHDVDPDAELAVVSADHVIRPVQRFADALRTAYDVLAARPEALVTDGLRSYGAALKELGAEDRQVTGRWENNRVENSHQPFRRREKVMLRFRRMHSLQKFVSVHASISNHFNSDRSLSSRENYKANRAAALAKWRALCAA